LIIQAVKRRNPASITISKRLLVRITITLDEELMRKAEEMTGIADPLFLIQEALKALIERESARRLADIVGTMPG
jgi:Bacterial antitoxin of type II TA system, VapB